MDKSIEKNTNEENARTLEAKESSKKSASINSQHKLEERRC